MVFEANNLAKPVKGDKAIVKEIVDRIDNIDKALTGITGSELNNVAITGGSIGGTTEVDVPVLKRNGVDISAIPPYLIGVDKDGTKSVTANYPTGVMGGYYWFDEFTINGNITVDNTIGFLVIQANKIYVTKGGGAVIDGAGKSVASIGLAGPNNNTYTANWGTEGGAGICAGSAGTGGAGGDGDGIPVPSGTYWGNYGGRGGKVYLDPVSVIQAGASSGTTRYSAGNHGPSGVNFPSNRFAQYISNGFISYGSSSGGSSPSTDNGSGYVSGRDGVKGGAGVALICNELILTTNLSIDTSGADGLSGYSGQNGSGGSGGGGGATIGIMYLTKTGTGIIITDKTGGNGGGYGGGAENRGGNGGGGGAGLFIEIDIENLSITVS